MTKKYRIFLAFGLTLALALIQASPSLANVIDFGTGIHHWAKECTYDGYSTVQYVGAASCPPIATLPANCTCRWTTHDFPPNNPYPYLVATSVDFGLGSETGTVSPVVHVTVDKAQVIDCNLSPTAGTCAGEGRCTDQFTVVETAPSRLDAGVVESVESLRDGFEEYFDGPVTFIYLVTQDSRGR